ncbi:transposase [Xenorhabdus miraniensis]|uniref:Transposase n=1 Tax=Xenorhabdus miraniensis TaxID=351674 RepID=A0A2D0JTR1_9GAMM|nr:transposase [Xenorhabdus miraniensis]
MARSAPLPEFGKWNSTFQRFNAWSNNGALHFIFNWLSSLIDDGIVRAHQPSSGAASEKDEAIGKSCGGLSTKIHLSVDSYGLPVHFELSGGQTHDIIHAESLVAQSPASDFVIAD